MKKKAKNAASMKSSNKQLILNIIRKNPLSRAEVARITGLTRAAVSIIIDEMIEEKLLVETGIGEIAIGRKPILLDINPDAYYSIGMYISRGYCILGMVDMKGKIITKTEIEDFNNINPAQVLSTASDKIRKMIDDYGIEINKILGLGISAPGPLDIYSGTILNPPNFNMWKRINVVEAFRKQFPFHVYLENNSTSLALAEKYFGLGRKYHNFMLLVVDSGIGAGIIINDDIYRGVYGFGSEVGHTSININGKQCNCGNRGCLEVYASIPAILEEAKKIDSSISSWNEIIDRALAGEKNFIDIVKMEASYLSAGIVNAMNILDLEAVVLTGYVNYKPGILLKNIQENVEKASITKNIHKINIDCSDIHENGDIISAATIVIEQFFTSDTFMN